MKNILYLGNYKDNNGFGQSCRRYLDWLISHKKFNVAARPLYVTNSSVAPPIKDDVYSEFENLSNKNYDTIIQNTYPEYIEYHKEFGKNIAIVEIETNNIKHSGWIDKLNMMDEIWVGSLFSAQSLINGGVFKTIKIVPEPYDISKYNQDYDCFFSYDTSNKPFIFYTMGQYTEKKNIKNIILAYLLEFKKKDNVRLFIKTCDHRQKNEDLENLIKFDMRQIKNMLRKNEDDYPDVDVLCGYLADKDVVRLHRSCDCYVNSVRGDGFGSSAIESAICGKSIINTKNIGSSTYFNSTNSLMLNASNCAVMSSNSIFRNVYTIYEQWFDPSIVDLRKNMRSIMTMTASNRNQLNDNFIAQTFDYTNIDSIVL